MTSSASGSPVIGLVLSGGRSRRMGTDKAVLAFHGRPQVEVCLGLLRKVCGDAYISVRADQVDEEGRKGLPQVIDRYGSIGPMDGILSAMDARPDAAWLVLACDLPFLGEDTVRHLLAQRDASKDATAFVSSSDGLPEPLCAIYEPAIRGKLHALLSQDVRCPRKALMRSDTKLVTLPDAQALDNVNEPAERDAAIRSLGGARTVTIRYYAQLREQRGLGEEELETSAPNARELYLSLSRIHGLTLDPQHMRVAINQQVSAWDRPVRAGDHVSFLPPASGG